MAYIETIAKPRGANERYQFFKNKDTGNEWKAAVVLKNADAPLIDGNVNVAPTTLAVTITVSPTKDNGKALRDNEDRPIIIDSWTHTFTAIEMEAPDFDPQARIVGIIAERIELGETKLKGNKIIKNVLDRWGGKTKIKATAKYEREIDNA